MWFSSLDHDIKHPLLFLSACFSVVWPESNPSLFYKTHHNMWQHEPTNMSSFPLRGMRDGEKQREKEIVPVFPSTSSCRRTTFLLLFLIMKRLSLHTMRGTTRGTSAVCGEDWTKMGSREWRSRSTSSSAWLKFFQSRISLKGEQTHAVMKIKTIKYNIS